MRDARKKARGCAGDHGDRQGDLVTAAGIQVVGQGPGREALASLVGETD